jgi:hypothetical protein
MHIELIFVQFTHVQGVNLKFKLFAGNSTTGNALYNKCSADIDVSMQVNFNKLLQPHIWYDTHACSFYGYIDQDKQIDLKVW